MEEEEFEVLWSTDAISFVLDWNQNMIDSFLGYPDEIETIGIHYHQFYGTERLLKATYGTGLHAKISFISEAWLSGYDRITVDEHIISGSEGEKKLDFTSHGETCNSLNLIRRPKEVKSIPGEN